MCMQVLRMVFGDAAYAIQSTFALMEIAEEEIDLAMREAYSKGEVERLPLIFAMFSVLTPPPGMSELGDFVYRAHARELLQRVVRAAELRVSLLRIPTYAEAVSWLTTASFEAPLSREGAAVYALALKRMAQAVKEYIPSRFAEALAELRAAAPPAWEGQDEELLGQVLRRTVLRELPQPQLPPKRRLRAVFGDAEAKTIWALLQREQPKAYETRAQPQVWLRSF